MKGRIFATTNTRIRVVQFENVSGIEISRFGNSPGGFFTMRT